jgi:hypothetical protein
LGLSKLYSVNHSYLKPISQSILFILESKGMFFPKFLLKTIIKLLSKTVKKATGLVSNTTFQTKIDYLETVTTYIAENLRR